MAVRKTASFFHVGKQLKQLVDIITMNTLHHAKLDHAYVLDVHFNTSAIDSDVTAVSTNR